VTNDNMIIDRGDAIAILAAHIQAADAYVIGLHPARAAAACAQLNAIPETTYYLDGGAPECMTQTGPDAGDAIAISALRRPAAFTVVAVVPGAIDRDRLAITLGLSGGGRRPDDLDDPESDRRNRLPGPPGRGRRPRRPRIPQAPERALRQLRLPPHRAAETGIARAPDGRPPQPAHRPTQRPALVPQPTIAHAPEPPKDRP
jgi:hypothetical protein